MMGDLKGCGAQRSEGPDLWVLKEEGEWGTGQTGGTLVMLYKSTQGERQLWQGQGEGTRGLAGGLALHRRLIRNP